MAVCNGMEEIMALLSKLRDPKVFFVEFVHSGQVAVNGDHATARWIIREVGKGPGETYYNTYGIFSDAMEKVDGKWLFVERAFHYMYLDSSPFTGDGYVLPDPLPTH